MKIGHIIIALAAAALAASCSIGTIDESQAPLVYREFTATLDPSTRTGLDANLKVLWDQSGESITIVDEQGIGYKLNQQSVSSDRRTATFSGAVPASGCILAVYPSQDNIDYDDGALTLTLPHEQTAVVESFASGANITIAKVNGNNLSFKNICGIISFCVDADNVTSISLSATGTSGGALAGRALVVFEESDPTCTSDIQSGSGHIELKGDIQSGKRYLALVYPGTYNNLKLVFTDKNGRTATFTKAADLTVERSKILKIPPITINDGDWQDTSSPGGKAMLTYAEISNPADYLKSYGNPTVYTNGYGDWNICAYNTGSAFQLNSGKVAYLGTPQFDGTITNVTIKNISDRTGNFIICTAPGDSNPPSSGTLTAAFNKECTVDIDVSSLSASKLYIRSSAMSHITELTVVWSSGEGPGPANPKVTTIAADNIGMADATIRASFSGIPTNPDPTAAFFRWGTSAGNLNQVIYDNATLLNTSSGTFSAALTGLTEATTYYYQAVITLANGSDVEGQVMSFTTRSAQQNTGNGYLDCYEVPAVNISGSMVSGNESSGKGYKWYRFKTTNSVQWVATHTLNESATNNKQIRSYTVLLDGSKKAPLWNAFIMHEGVFPHKVESGGSWGADPAFDPGNHSDWQQNGVSGYSKGHLCASNYRRSSTSARNQTYYYTNQAPQIQDGFNGGIWSQMEGAIVSASKNLGRDTLYVTVGVLYEWSIKYVSSVPIPSHFYTCIMKCSFNASGEMTGAQGCGYIMENKKHSGNDYNSYKETIDNIEKRAGFDFFHNVPDEFENTAEKQTAAIL